MTTDKAIKLLNDSQLLPDTFYPTTKCPRITTSFLASLQAFRCAEDTHIFVNMSLRGKFVRKAK